MNVEIIPKKICGTVSAPSSKSAAHRHLICAALSEEKSTLKINGISDDISATVSCLRQLGADIKTDGENISVIPAKIIPERAVFDCGESGSTLRFMIPVAAALGINSVFTGRGRLSERPVAELLDELKRHGINCESGFPIKMSGRLAGGRFSMAGDISSQYITGLLLAMPIFGGELEIKGAVESRPYIDLTVGIMKKYGIKIEEKNNIFSVEKQEYISRDFCVEGDWSNAAPFLALGAGVKNLEKNSAQGDKNILKIFEKFGAEICEKNDEFSVKKSRLSGTEIDAADVPDLVPVIAVVAAAAKGTTVIKNVRRLRFKESDRVFSTVQLINSLGGNAEARENEIIITGKEKLAGGVAESFNDHRIVMAATVAAQFCEDKVIIKNAEAVGKSYPDFFDVYKSVGGEANVVQLR